MKRTTLLFPLLLCHFICSGNIYKVSNNGDSGSGTLRQAVSDANSNPGKDTIIFVDGLNGDTIILTSGSISLNSEIIMLGNGQSNTIIDGDSSRIFNINSTIETEIRDLQLRNGESAFPGGGAVYINDCSPSFYNVYFTDNRTSGPGDGAAVNISLTGADNNSLFFKCTFENNTSNDDGGAIIISVSNGEARTRFEQCTFLSNTANDVRGGAIYLIANDMGNNFPVFTSCIVSSNTAVNGTSSGGGIYAIAVSGGECSPTIINSSFIGNSALLGGGLFCLGSVGECNPTVVNSEFRGNYAGVNGGGFYVYLVSGAVKLTIINSSIAGNYADTEGGGIYALGDLSTDVSLIIHNTVVWGNNTGIEGAFYSQESSHSLIQDILPTGPGDMDGTNPENDPVFLDLPDFSTAPFTNGNLRLQTCSPLINSGNNDLMPDSITTDPFSTPRIEYGQIDIGAFEMPDPKPVTAPFEADCQDPCLYTLNLIGETIDGTYESANKLNTVGTVETTGNTIFKSSEFRLDKGFTTVAGFSFETLLEPCTP